MSTFDNTAFENLEQLLAELQIELGRRAWTSDRYQRINQAVDFRGKLWDAIAAYRDAYAE